MLRLSSSFDNVKTWLLSSGLFISDTKDENCGGVYSFYDEKKKKFMFVYPEITGYFLSTLRFLYHLENDKKYLEYSQLSAGWIIDIYNRYGGIIHGISSDQSGKQKITYSFDTAICAKGLIDNFLVTNDKNSLEYAKKMLTNMIAGALEDDGTVKPFRNLDTNEFSQSNDVWYKQKGCLHIKIAMPLVQLYRLEKDSTLLKYATRICDTYTRFQNHDGSLSLHNKGEIINLHTLCYAVEGLLFTYAETKNSKYLEACEKALGWCMEKIETDGSISLWTPPNFKSKSSYSIAQVIRLMILLDKLGNKNSYKKNFEKLRSFLLTLQNIDLNPNTNGAFSEELYKSTFSWKRRQKLNSWGSMFALQALYWFDNYEKITFDKIIEYLY